MTDKTDLKRRSFLKKSAITTAGVATASLNNNVFASIEKALSIPANRKNGNLNDIEHVVILMLENRSYDHILGVLPGGRGYADRFPLKQTNGEYVWKQYNSKYAKDLNKEWNSKTLLPWHFDTQKDIGYEFIMSSPHTYNNMQLANNHGKNNQWLPNKTDRVLGYYTEQDIPIYYALANAFTVCDAYYCSLQMGTHPNRNMLYTGSIDNYGRKNGPSILNNNGKWRGADNGDPKSLESGYQWMTYPERLQEAGISWRMIQNRDDEYGCNTLPGFYNYRKAVLDNGGLDTDDTDSLLYRAIGPNYGWRVADGGNLLLKYLRKADRLPSFMDFVRTNSGHPQKSTANMGGAYVSEVLDILLQIQTYGPRLFHC